MNQIDLDGLNEQNQDAPNDARVRHLNQLEYLLSANQDAPNDARVRHLNQLEYLLSANQEMPNVAHMRHLNQLEKIKKRDKICKYPHARARVPAREAFYEFEMSKRCVQSWTVLVSFPEANISLAQTRWPVSIQLFDLAAK